MIDTAGPWGAQAASGVPLFLPLPEGVPPAPAVSVQSKGALCVEDSFLILWWMLGHDKLISLHPWSGLITLSNSKGWLERMLLFYPFADEET